MSLMQGQAPLSQAMLCPVSGEAYTLEQGLKWLVSDDYDRYFFEAIEHAPPQGEPLGYGLNIFHSEDGITFTRAQAAISHQTRDPRTTLVYEAYTAKVPPQAKHIRVTLDEMAKLHSAKAAAPIDYVVNSPFGETGLALAAVSVYGDSLVVGVPDPIVLPEFPWEDYIRPPEDRTIIYEYREMPREEASSSKQESSSSKRESTGEEADELEMAPPILDEASEPKPREASSKFTGTISENSERPSRQAEVGEPESVWKPEDEYWAADQPPPEAAPAAIEIAAAPTEDTGFTKGVTAYIVLASGGLAALVLFKPK